MAKNSKQVALVTGGSRGIGLGIATTLAESGFDLAINGVRAESEISDSLAALQKRGAAVHYCRGDVAIASDREQIVATVRENLGRLDVLVNNAGVAPSPRAPEADSPLALWVTSGKPASSTADQNGSYTSVSL